MRHGNDPSSLSHIAPGAALETLAERRPEAAVHFNDAPLIPARVALVLIGCGEALIAMALGAGLYVAHRPAPSWDAAFVYGPVILAIGLILPLALQAIGAHAIPALAQVTAQAARITAVWSVMFLATAAVVFFLKAGTSFSRLWLASWYLSGLGGLILYRYAIAALMRRWHRNGQLVRRAVLVGGGEPAERLIEALNSSETSDIAILGIFDDRGPARSPVIIAGYPKLGSIGGLVDLVRRTRVDLLIVTFPLAAEARLLDVLKHLWVLPVDIRLSAHAQKLRYRPRAYSYIGNVPFLDVFDKPLSDWGAFVKAAEDKLVTLILLALAAPVMAIIALAIRLDSAGPILFRQTRYGFNNEPIEVYKFRSMHADQADARADRLVTRDDPRVTRIGRFLRKTSLDEVPQLFNVLKGELSLVGPRPHSAKAKAADALYDEVVEGYFARHRVKPGITGWAQINGWRGETDTAEKILRRVEHDLYYIENWSLALDLYILMRTPAALFNTENAY